MRWHPGILASQDYTGHSLLHISHTLTSYNQDTVTTLIGEVSTRIIISRNFLFNLNMTKSFLYCQNVWCISVSFEYSRLILCENFLRYPNMFPFLLTNSQQNTVGWWWSAMCATLTRFLSHVLACELDSDDTQIIGCDVWKMLNCC